MKKVLLLLGIAATGCNSIKSADRSEEEGILLQKGDSIARQVQVMLLTSVTNAAQDFGVAGAVRFCNEKAIVLTDSAGGDFEVRRLSNKNRNPVNAIVAEADQEAWVKMQALLLDSTVKEKHFVARHQDNIYYYKAIHIAMPACLNCHGIAGKDIEPATEKIIRQSYPDDKAIGYVLGDLRGIWRIKMNNVYENLP